MKFKLELLSEKELEKFKKDMQEAFQKGFEDFYGPTEETILPEKGSGEGFALRGIKRLQHISSPFSETAASAQPTQTGRQ